MARKFSRVMICLCTLLHAGPVSCLRTPWKWNHTPLTHVFSAPVEGKFSVGVCVCEHFHNLYFISPGLWLNPCDIYQTTSVSKKSPDSHNNERKEEKRRKNDDMICQESWRSENLFGFHAIAYGCKIQMNYSTRKFEGSDQTHSVLKQSWLYFR